SVHGARETGKAQKDRSTEAHTAPLTRSLEGSRPTRSKAIAIQPSGATPQILPSGVSRPARTETASPKVAFSSTPLAPHSKLPAAPEDTRRSDVPGAMAWGVERGQTP